MKFLCCFLVSLLVVGVYSNCGCLKCNPETLRVVSPPESPLKVIYKSAPCHCPRYLPYSLQIPVAPPPSSCNLRCYGYRVERQKLPPVVPCPIPRNYNAQIQIPCDPKPKNYLVGLIAAPDRVVLPGPPPSDCPPYGIRRHLPPISFDTLADPKPDYFYLPKVPSCGCERRYARLISIPEKLPEVSKTFQTYSYLTPTPYYNSNTQDSGTATYFYWKTQKRSPIIRKTYRRIFYPSASGITVEDELKYDSTTPLTSHVINLLKPNLFENKYNSKTNFLDIINQIRMTPRKQISQTVDFTSPKIYFPRLNFPRGLYHVQHFRPTKDHIFQIPHFHRFEIPRVNGFSNLFNPNKAFGIEPSVFKEINMENRMYRIPNETPKTDEYKIGSDKTNALPQSNPIKISIHLPRLNLNKQRSDENQTTKASNDVFAETLETMDKLNLKSSSQGIDIAQQKAENVDNQTKEIDSTKGPFIKRGFQNIRFSLSPKQKKISYMEEFFLTNRDSKPTFVINSKTVELSNLDKYKYNIEPQNETLENTASARERRAINMRLLSLKPEYPPKILRKYPLQRNEQVALPYQKEQVITSRNNKISSPLKQKKSRPNLKKSKSNAILKSNLKRTNAIIKNWLSKLKPLNPPEILIPKFPESINHRQWWMDEANVEETPQKKKILNGFKNLKRHRRAIRQKENDILPYFNLPEVNKKRVNKKDELETKRKSSTDPFLAPFNLEHILHPTPMLHLLNTPIRYLNHIHKLRSHVQPVVSTFPKVVQASRQYLLGLVKECGKNMYKLGTNFVKDIAGLKKLKLLPKLRHKRSSWADQEKTVIIEGINKEPETARIKSKPHFKKWNKDQNQFTLHYNKDGEGKKSNHSCNKHEGIVDDIMLIISDILHNHKNLQQNHYDGIDHNSHNNRQEIGKQVDIEGIVQSFLNELVSVQNQNDLETKDNLLLQRTKREMFRNGNYYSKLFRKSSPITFKKYKRETEAENINEDEMDKFLGETKAQKNDKNEIDKFLGNSKDDTELKRFMRYTELPEDFLKQSEAPVNKDQPAKWERRKRSTYQNSEKELKVSPSQVLTKEKQKMLNLSELDVQKQIIKENVAKILKKIKTIKNYETLEDLEIYKDLLQLEKLKLNIIIQLILHRVEDFAVTKKEAENLKNTVFKQIIDKLYKQRYISSNDWIRKMILLQKFHCIVRKTDPKQENKLQIEFLKTLNFIPEKNEEEILTNIKATKTQEIERLNNVVQKLKLVLDSENVKNVKKVAKVLWATSNVEKLQKDSIVELHKKIIQGLQIRKELKILFDLQRQLETFEDKEKSLIGNLEK